MKNLLAFLVISIAFAAQAIASEQNGSDPVGAARFTYSKERKQHADCGISFVYKTVKNDPWDLDEPRRSIRITKKEDLAALKELKIMALKIREASKTYLCGEEERAFSRSEFPGHDQVDTQSYGIMRLVDSPLDVWQAHYDVKKGKTIEGTLDLLRSCEAKRYVELVDQICNSTLGKQNILKGKNQRRLFNSEESCKM